MNKKMWNRKYLLALSACTLLSTIPCGVIHAQTMHQGTADLNHQQRSSSVVVPARQLPAGAGSTAGSGGGATILNDSEAQGVSNRVVVKGVVPDEETRAAVLSRLRELYGADKVSDQMQVKSGVVSPPNWSANVQKIIGQDLQQIRQGQLSINGSNIEVKGEVGNEATQQQLVSRMAGQLNSSYSIKNGLKVAASEQVAVDAALANRIIEFEAGSSKLTPKGLDILNEMLTALSKLNGKKVEVVGHTDDQGAHDANIALSLARADAVRSYLVTKGINPGLISISGEGPDRPVASNATAEGRARNRRIEFRVSR